MKKLVLLLSALVMGISFASGECLDFNEGKLCLKVRNAGDGNYKIERELQQKVVKKIYVLNCQVLRPDNKLVDLGPCEKDVVYSGSGKLPLRFYVEFEGQKNVINMDYNFSNMTAKQASTVNQFYTSWYTIVGKLKTTYPKLSSSTEWNNLVNNMYTNIGDFMYGRSSTISSYNGLVNAIVSFVNSTQNLSK